MEIIVLLESTGQKLSFIIDENDTVQDLKDYILKKTNIPINRQKLTHNLTVLNNNSLLSDYDLEYLSTIKLKVIMGAFGIQKKRTEIDINTFVIDNIYNYLSDIIIFIWGNAITVNRNITEYRTYLYKDFHDVFRQQLPLPILEKAYSENKNVTIYSVDEGFLLLNETDIRNILLKYSEPVIVDKIEHYSIPMNVLFSLIGLSFTDNLINTSIVNFYFIPYTYGFCKLSKSETTDIQLCLRELQENLELLVHEYYIYGQPLDIDTVLSTKDTSLDKLITWHDRKGGGKVRKLPRKYTKRLSNKDKKKQTKNIRRSIKSYKKGKYINRPKLKSYKNKKSSWVTKFEKKYGKDIKTYKEIEKATGIPSKALREVVKKGQGAYYSSGSRPNQTAHSWGKARMYSYIMGGKTRKYDTGITKKYNVKFP